MTLFDAMNVETPPASVDKATAAFGLPLFAAALIRESHATEPAAELYRHPHGDLYCSACKHDFTHDLAWKLVRGSADAVCVECDRTAGEIQAEREIDFLSRFGVPSAACGCGRPFTYANSVLYRHLESGAYDRKCFDCLAFVDHEAIDDDC